MHESCATIFMGIHWWRMVPLQKEASQIARFSWPTWGPPGSCRPQVGPMLAPWTLLAIRSGRMFHVVISLWEVVTFRWCIYIVAELIQTSNSTFAGCDVLCSIQLTLTKFQRRLSFDQYNVNIPPSDKPSCHTWQRSWQWSALRNNLFADAMIPCPMLSKDNGRYCIDKQW